MFCNAPTVRSSLISDGIEMLRNNQMADSAVTVSRYNMYSPSRARRIDKNGELHPYIDFCHHPNSEDINCDRDSQEDVWFADVSVSVIRPKNLDNLEDNIPPQRYVIPPKNQTI